MEILTKMSATDIDATFNPFKIKDKWMRFFRTGLTKFTQDTDRALKNQFCENLNEFILDEILTFNDVQLIRAFLLLTMVNEKTVYRTKDKVFSQIISNLQQGKFAFRSGNNMATFAQAYNMNHQQLFTNCEDIPLDFYKNEHMTTVGIGSIKQSLFNNGSAQSITMQYQRMVVTCGKFAPYLKHFFTKYQPNQKLVVLKMFQNLSVYDEELFTNFVGDLVGLSKTQLAKKLETICITHNPLSMEQIDRTYDLLEVLDFHLQHCKEPQPLVTGEFREALGTIIIEKISQEPEYLHNFDTNQKQFRGVYPNLFRASDFESQENLPEPPHKQSK